MFGLVSKYIIFVLFLSFACKPVKADIEPFNIVVKTAVADVAEVKKELSDAKDVVEKNYAIVSNGFSKIKAGAEQVKNFAKDPVGALKTMVMKVLEKDDPEEAGFESLEKTKEAYSRKKGVENNIALQKRLNQVINTERINNTGRLLARSITKRIALKEEETEEPDLSTLAAARQASNQKQISLGKRYNSILETWAYINAFNNSTQIQNYLIEEEEE